ncbi:LysR family transcriptional regulator [Actinokineospora sp. 24-640]
MDIAIRHLRILAVLGAEGSFRRAAARLGVGQPTLSRQVKRMERVLGVVLVLRTPVGVLLTPAGEALARHASVMNEAFDDLLRELRHLEADRRTGKTPKAAGERFSRSPLT